MKHMEESKRAQRFKPPVRCVPLLWMKQALQVSLVVYMISENIYHFSSFLPSFPPSLFLQLVDPVFWWGGVLGFTHINCGLHGLLRSPFREAASTTHLVTLFTSSVAAFPLVSLIGVTHSVVMPVGILSLNLIPCGISWGLSRFGRLRYLLGHPRVGWLFPFVTEGKLHASVTGTRLELPLIS